MKIAMFSGVASPQFLVKYTKHPANSGQSDWLNRDTHMVYIVDNISSNKPQNSYLLNGLDNLHLGGGVEVVALLAEQQL